MNQNLNIKIYSILLVVLSFCGGCKMNSDKNNIESTGSWSWQYSAEDNSYLNRVFTLDLIQTGNVLTGKYCAIVKNGARIDCYYRDKTNNINGTVKGDTIFVDFVGHYDQSATGKAVLFKKGNALVWNITESQGDIFAPKYAELRKSELESKKEHFESLDKQKSGSSCLYSINCSCEENNSGKSIYEDSLQLTCRFTNMSFEEVYEAIYKTETNLEGFLLSNFPEKSLIHTDSETFSTDYKIEENRVRIYISQENGGFEFILKQEGGKIVLEKHVFPG
ncbi:hypothetical protein Q4566_01045 [Tamlana sp. 2_MG-2023]|uniref:hypothetical protein n=1 Tax=unclassified Tamlana TaxID=2614803 RepID=UPI0026E20EC4|nr:MULTISPECIES: hypothetical protein [unclassified Tamlana]MDO6758769.1 hypothetical protein [Tamlana sp. 2_MG-2023]MDO6789468.1 hypothetical protein [Tamlana sp. 1_MG-2023]